MKKLQKIKSAIKGFIYGATVYGMVQDLEKRMAYMEYALMCVTIGDMLGIPISSYYRYKVLPYVFLKIKGWEQYLLKEKDII